MRICDFPDCGFVHYGLGWCLAHYRQVRLGEAPRPVRRRHAQAGCDFPGCTRPHRTGGLCNPHFRQQQRGGELRALTAPTPARGLTCEFPSCGKPRVSRGFCPGHYSQQRLGAPLTTLRVVDPQRGCRVRTCDAKHYANGLCKNHNRRCATYNLTPDEVAELFSATACAACDGEFTRRGKLRPDVDHDHRTGKVRGLVHARCNLAIGLLEDDPTIAQAVTDYLLRSSRGATGTGRLPRRRDRVPYAVVVVSTHAIDEDVTLT